jgi:hypothetical protein
VPSLVWSRDAKDAVDNPYEYGIQDQFVREASALLSRLYRRLNRDSLRYSRNERSVAKAIWLLQMDALDLRRVSMK